MTVPAAQAPGGAAPPAPEALPGLYVHVPFCRRTCPYCDFYSCRDLSLTEPWLQALEQELRRYCRQGSDCFATLYFGGGSPSVLTTAQFTWLFEAIRRQSELVAGAEVTLEANPADITAAKLRTWRALGVTRISLGVQSFDDAVLQGLGRMHTAATARAALARIRRAGFDNVSIDLIYAVPGQSRRSWECTVTTALQEAPAHLSCYELTVKPGTAFARQQSRGDLPHVPETVRAHLFLETGTRLREAGYLHYEVSSFARTPAHMARHNQCYWDQRPYLGLGPAAHSFLGGRRWWNCASVQGYIDALARGHAPVQDCEELTLEQRHLETLLLRFRTAAGMSRMQLQRYPRSGSALPELVSAGLLEICGATVRPTLRGMLVADSLPLQFV